MNYIDSIILILVLWFGFKGFRNGLIMEAASLAALLLGLYGAMTFSGKIASFLSSSFNLSSQYLPAISFGAIFLIIVVVVFLIGRLIDLVVKAAAMGLFNRLAGMLFGAAKIILILSFIIYSMNEADKNLKFMPPEVKEKSLLFKPLSAVVPYVFPSVKKITD